MTQFEIDLYREIIYAFKGTARKLTFPQILLALGKQDASLAEKSSIATLLHDADFQRILWQTGTLLWRGHDQRIRIVDQFAMEFRQDVGKYLCRLCLMEEDDRRELIRHDDESYVHPLCQDRFQKLQNRRRMLEQRVAENEQ